MASARTSLETYFKNFPYLKKTVIVENNDFTLAFQALRKILRNDKVLNTIKFQEVFERPTRWRRRIMYERCKRIYDAEMTRKINFISRTHRIDPWPR